MLVYKFRSLGFSTHTMHMHSKFTKFGRKFDKKMDYFGFKKKKSDLSLSRPFINCLVETPLIIQYFDIFNIDR